MKRYPLANLSLDCYNLPGIQQHVFCLTMHLPPFMTSYFQGYCTYYTETSFPGKRAPLDVHLAPWDVKSRDPGNEVDYAVVVSQFDDTCWVHSYNVQGSSKNDSTFLCPGPVLKLLRGC